MKVNVYIYIRMYMYKQYIMDTDILLIIILPLLIINVRHVRSCGKQHLMTHVYWVCLANGLQ
jgi:hypothetical protein